MGNFTFGEIITIVIVILIVFGPNRLPEMARKAGQLAARARDSMAALRAEFTAEYREVVEPIQQVREELRGTRAELKGDVDSLRNEVKRATDETAEEVRKLEAVEGDVAANPVPDSLPQNPAASESGDDELPDEETA